MIFPRCRARIPVILGTGLSLLVTGVPAGLLLGAPSAFAQTADVKIDTLKVGVAPDDVELRGVEVLGSNLSRGDIEKLFDAATPGVERKALVSRLKASSFGISEIAILAPQGGATTIRGLRADGIDAGKIGRFTMAGFDGAPVIEGVASTVKGGALTLDDVDVSGLLKAAAGSTAGLKIARMSWNGFEASVPDKDTPADAPGGNLVKIRIGAMDGQSTYDGDTPLQSSGAIRNLAIEFPKASSAGQMLAALGYDKVDLGATFHGAYDPAKKAYLLDDMTVSGAGFGSLGLRAALNNFDPALLKGDEAQRRQDVAGIDLASVDVRVVNSGLYEKGTALLAQQQGKTPDALRKEWIAAVTQLAPLFMGGDPSSLTVVSAASTFLTAGKSFTLSVKGRKGPVRLASVNTSDPVAALSVFSITAAAESGPSAAAPAAPAAPQVAQAPQAAAPAARKLTGLEAWNVIVGNSVTGKSTDGDPLTEYYLKNGTLKQLVDDEVTKGKWAVKGQQVCFEYDDEDDEECYKLEVVGDVATFIDSDGKGKRYTIVKGNPKNL